MSGSLTPALEPAPVDQGGGLAARLTHNLGRINRGLRYRTRAARETLDVTHSEAELLRLLHRRPGIRVQDAALDLGVASNSVSTLVKQLGRVGLIERTPDPADGRGACLHLTAHAEEYVTRVRNAREEVLDRALASLDPTDHAALEAAVPALCRLAKAIARVDGASQ